MQTLRQDLRYGFRMLIKRPGFTAIAVLTLALGIGANTTIFSFVNTLYLQPPALVEKPDQLVSVVGARGNRPGEHWTTHPKYLEYRNNNTVFSELAARGQVRMYLSVGDEPKEVFGLGVSANYFSTLGVKPALGRFFLPEEDTVPGRDPVVVLSYDFWRQQFGGDPNIIGQSIYMSRLQFTVIGIAPEGFHGIFANSQELIWVPSMMSGIDKSNGGFTDMIGRLKPGRTIEVAKAELTTIAGQLEMAYPDTNNNLSVYLAPLAGIHPARRQNQAQQSSLHMAVVALVLLIACANLAGLLLARGAARRKEIAVRLALGASRIRLIRQLMTESLLLSLFGGMAGLLIAFWGKDLIASFFSYNFTNLNIALDPLVLGYTLLISVIAGFIFGLVPALQATRFNLVPALKDTGLAGGYRQSKLRAALVVGQVALSLVLMVSAGLVIQSLRSVLVNPGFDHSNIAHFRLSPQIIGYDAPKAHAYYQELIRRLEALPGVESVILARVPPNAADWGSKAHVSLPGQTAVRPEDAFEIDIDDITPGYFKSLRYPAIRGREFTEQDQRGAPLVAIVNETLSRRLWPDGEPIGRVVVIDGKEHSVIGVAETTHPHKSNEAPIPFLYRPYWQTDDISSRLFIRVAGDAQSMLALLLREMIAVNPDMHIGQQMLLSERMELSYESERLIGSLLIYSGLLALFLSVIGLYGTLAHAVNQRTREIGIRMALGARVTNILKLVMGQGLWLVLLGIAFGLMATLGVTRVLSSHLYGITASDPLTFVGISLSLLVVALLACYIPARRATRVDPGVALRYE
jgi:putative ABC transport system permease protein